jgi:predicted DCC family thiol-disulfide oxidoreductase YuxK
MQNSTTEIPHDKALILFDGYCNLCNGAVQFIIKRDPKEHFLYTSLSSKTAMLLLSDYSNYDEVDSILLYSSGKVYTKSSAALRIAGKLSGLWPILFIFLLVPKFLRDSVYDFIARNRYRWFGKKESCMVPKKKVSHLFLS